MNKKLEWAMAASVVILAALGAMDYALGKWIDGSGLLMLAAALAMQWVTSRKLRKGYKQQLASMQFKYGDLVKTTDFGYRGMVISDRPATGWVSVVLFKSGGEQAAVYSPFDLEKTS